MNFNILSIWNRTRKTESLVDTKGQLCAAQCNTAIIAEPKMLYTVIRTLGKMCFCTRKNKQGLMHLSFIEIQ